MKKINDLISKLAVVSKDIAEQTATEKKASEDLLLVANPGVSVADARARILDARLTIDLARSHLAVMEPLHAQLTEELVKSCRSAASVWNDCVQTVKVAEEDAIVESTTRLFEGDETACRNWWELGHFIRMPIFAKYREAWYDDGAFRLSRQWDALQAASHFKQHIQRHASILGIKPSLLA